MRFGFTTLDHRVGLSVADYSAPPIVFPYEVTNENLFPLLARYSADQSLAYAGSDYFLEVDEGYYYQYKANSAVDLGVYFNEAAFALAGAVFQAAPSLVKAIATAADVTSWGGSLPATITSIDGVPMDEGDAFFVHNISAQNGVYRISSGGSFSQELIPSAFGGTGITVKAVEGVSNAQKYFWFDPSDAEPRRWREGTAGKMHYRFVGTPGMLVTATFRRVIV
jgi:hypothetical protein